MIESFKNEGLSKYVVGGIATVKLYKTGRSIGWLNAGLHNVFGIDMHSKQANFQSFYDIIKRTY